MLKLKPVCKNYIWGGDRLHTLFGRGNDGERVAESWEVSVHPDGESLTDTGEALSAVLARAGISLPILIKYIDAKENLSVQVHPDDAYAHAHGGDNGKTEMWYVLDAAPGAGIYCGLEEDTDPAAFLRAVGDGTVEKLLHFIPVRPGDCYLIPAGTVHAIGAGCLVCEIQQNSNVTYRVYDYGRRGIDGKPRELHLGAAMDVIGFHRFFDVTGRRPAEPVGGGMIRHLTSCPLFRVRELRFDGTFSCDVAGDFLAVTIPNGKGMIRGKPFSAGDSFLLLRGEKLELSGHGLLLLTDGAPSVCGSINKKQENHHETE